jgi:predicted transcriptional regulator
VTSWLASKTIKAPPALRERVAQLARRHASPDRPLADQLAAAAAEALEMVVAHPGDRSVALELLSADALITLALLSRAEENPAGLAEFADGLVAGTLGPSDR